MKEILAFLGSVPTLLKLIEEMGKFLKDKFGDSPDKFIKDSTDVFKQYNDAKTIEEKDAAFKKVYDLVNRI